MNTLFFFLSSLLLTLPTGLSTDPNQLIGKWSNADHTRVVEFSKAGELYEAVILEAQNPDHVGRKQLTGMKYSDSKKRFEGSLHVLQRNRTIPCQIIMQDSRTLLIEASFGPMARKEKWTRTN